MCNMFGMFLYSSDNPDIFFYTNQGEAPLIDGVDDAEEFMNTREAMSLLGESFIRYIIISNLKK